MMGSSSFIFLDDLRVSIYMHKTTIPMDADVIVNMSSQELINLMAEHGLGSPYKPGDGRNAFINETGTFTGTIKKSYVEVVVSVKDEIMYDVRVRLYVSKDPYEFSSSPSHTE